MKLAVTKDSGTRKMLQSWTSASDPSTGRFSIGIDSFAFPQLFIWDDDRSYWRSGPWNGNNSPGIQYNNPGSNIIGAGFILKNDRQGTVSLTSYSANQSFSSNYALKGVLAQKWWDESKKKW
uniref:S-locus glycoprotein domain-containing protein n=1 Tax=Opuntia streptacantha TaxID=393608 RepID=A0A7C8YUK0_OPUST